MFQSLGRVALVDDLQRQLVGRRDLRAAALAVVKNSSSVDFLRLGVVA